MSNTEFYSIIITCLVLSAVILLGLSLMSAVSDEKQEYFEDGCLVQVHKDNRLRGEDTVKIERLC